MGINEQQVGGTHYQSEYPHWDWVIDTRQSYLTGCVTKYVSRWRVKGGVQDLKKALHYLDKEISVEGYGVAWPWADVRLVLDNTKRFAQLNGLTEIEAQICTALTVGADQSRYGPGRKDYQLARGLLLTLIQANEPVEPVPAEDSNKHSERV